MRLEDTVRIPLRAKDGSIRAYTVIDAMDAGWANHWRWYLTKRGYVGRAERLPDGHTQTFYLHRELLGLTPGDGLEGDHKNLDPLDNRRQNLRAVPRQGRPNTQNTRSRQGASSAYRGVYWDKESHKWRATIRVNRKLIHLGYFVDEAEAGDATKRARTNLMPYATN